MRNALQILAAPILTLLDLGKPTRHEYSHEQIAAVANRLQLALQQLERSAGVVPTHPDPASYTVTPAGRVALELEEGTGDLYDADGGEGREP